MELEQLFVAEAGARLQKAVVNLSGELKLGLAVKPIWFAEPKSA